MAIRRFILIPIILLLFFVTAKAADAEKPYYTAKGTYNAETHIYTVDVYLTTDDYLAAGTFGMEFDDAINPTWHDGTVEGENVGYLQIDKRYFTLVEPEPFEEARGSLQGKKYVIAMWGVNEADAQTPVRGELYLGTITIPNVTPNEEGYPDSWSDKPFRLLNWNNTDLSKSSLFTRTDENDTSSRPINEEIWRDITPAEKTALDANAPEGYYQGFIFDTDGNSTQTDIDFTFTAELENSSNVISGSVECYNPKNTIQITAYSAAEEAYAAEITGYVIYADGRIVYDYEINVPENGKYTLVYSKQSHLTYITQITVEEKTAEAPNLKLICGDIDGDGHIKYPDRAELIRHLNRQKSWTASSAQFDKADLNGDGLVNLFDLNILKSNFNKTY